MILRITHKNCWISSSLILRIVVLLVRLFFNPSSLVHSSNASVADYVVYTTTDVAAHALNLDPTDKMRSSVLSLSDKMHNRYCGFEKFVSNVIRKSRTRTSTILVALLYLNKAKPCLDVPPLDWILHRLFLGALILATKVRHIPRSFAIIRGY